MLNRIKAIMVDGDDTVWYDRRYFKRLYGRARAIVGEGNAALLKKAVEVCGYGEAGFVQAIQGVIQSLCIQPARELEGVLSDFASHPVELLPGAKDALRFMSSVCPLILYTSGIKAEQERKILDSGVQDLFTSTVVVESKTEDSLRNLIIGLGVAPDAAIMVGNSIRYDVLPSLAVGVIAVWMNHGENEHGRDSVKPDGILEVSGWDELTQLWQREP